MKTYSQLIKFATFDERFEYLRLKGIVGEDTFGFKRYLNQSFYTSKEWREFRRKIIIRDNGLDLGMYGRDIQGGIYVHHIIPITPKDLDSWNIEHLLNPENVICCSYCTHQAIHYGDCHLLPQEYVGRYKNDTCPWK